jgi:chromosome partitioning protein
MAVNEEVVELERPEARPPKRRTKAEEPAQAVPVAATADSKAAPRDIKRVLITSPKGGSGKTELSKGLAVAAAMSGLNVAVADFDPQRSLYEWWQRRPDPEAMSGLAQLEAYQGDMADAQSIYEVVNHDLLIIATSPGIESHPQIKILIMAAAYILVPSQASLADTDSVRKWMPFLTSYKRPSAFVLNAVDPRAKHILLPLSRT